MQAFLVHQPDEFRATDRGDQECANALAHPREIVVGNRSLLQLGVEIVDQLAELMIDRGVPELLF